MDGEHYPPVVRAAIEHLPTRVPGCEVVGAALVGGGEKLAHPESLELGVPVVRGGDAEQVLLEAIGLFSPEIVVDLSDEPVLDARLRTRLAARTLVAGLAYVGSDFRFDPPPRPRLATKPSVAVIGAGKRTGKTAVSAHLARLLAGRGTPPVIVAMGRGGPPEPELVDPAVQDLTAGGLLALAARGRHAASDHLEGALVAGVVTVGTRRCGGGLAGAPFESNFGAGVVIADGRSEPLLVFEGSGTVVPPVHADATICVVPVTADPELVTGYLGAYRVLLSDLIVVTMVEPSLAVSGAGASKESPVSDERLANLEKSVRGLAPGVRVVHTVLRPYPLEPISGRRVFYVTTAPNPVLDLLAGYLESEHGCKVVGTSNHLANRPQLEADLKGIEEADVVLVELKAAAVDVVARVAMERGTEVIFCDNRVVSTGGDGTFDELGPDIADLAVRRHKS